MDPLSFMGSWTGVGAPKVFIGISFLAYEFGVLNVVLESEAQLVVNWLNNGVSFLSEVDVILNDIYHLLGLVLSSSVCFVPRTANQVAHQLAKMDLSSSIGLYWIEDFPPYVRRLVASECSEPLVLVSC
ncbi:hypothetical protein Ddye_028777 [Dipteronia dyeriana]|uniref:RNase H type-1 domain-containing protein n=1 Tax=Dipteronia dyeriana TaxID=168575 RepID=A0AAD9TDZ4_9ROSI|nr:hypothetical protein Ddye_028777 [Dipteronia dyeriana]